MNNKLFYTLFLILLVCGASLRLSAFPKQQSIRFSLDKPFSVVLEDKEEPTKALGDKITTFMRSNGAAVQQIRWEGKRYPTSKKAILIKRITDLEGRENHFSITVSKKQIQLLYTTPQSAEKAYKLLIADYHPAKAGDKNQYGYFSRLWEDESYVTPKVRRIDLVAEKSKDFNAIRTKIERSIQGGSDTVELRLLSENGFALQCKTFDLASVNAKAVAPPHLTIPQLKEVMEDHPNNQFVGIITFAPPRDSRFKERIGHNMLSVEGLRFVRSFVNDALEQLPLDHYIIEHNANEMQYKEYILPVIELLEENKIVGTILKREEL